MPGKLFDPYRDAAAAQPEAQLKRLLQVYEIAVHAASQHNLETVAHCLDLLDAALDPHPNPELALTLHELYGDCRSALSEQRFDELAAVLAEMAGLWQAHANLARIRQTAD